MFSNLKVIELASVLAGPDVGMFFSELGADVIKIENKLTGGDVTRNWKLASEDVNSSISAYYSSVNWGKKSIFLDLTDKKDQKVVYKLVKDSDIVIVNFKPGDDKKLEMDYNTLREFNKNIIYGEINGYGEDSNRSAYDVVLQAETGFMFMNGTPNSGPIKMPIALIDVLAAHQLKEGLLIALLKKEKTGQGSKVEVSLYDAALASLKNQATNWLMNNHIPQPIGSLHPNIAPYGETFFTKDNKIVVLAIGSDKQFSKLLTILKAEKLMTLQEFKTNHLRVINRKLLDKKLTSYFKKQNRAQLMEHFIKENVPVGALNNMEDVFENPKAQKLVLEQEIENRNTKRVKTAIFKLS